MLTEPADAPEVFVTDRLRLRPARDDDAPKIFAGWGRDEDVTRYLTWRPHTKLADAEGHVARCKKGWEKGSPLVYLLEETPDGWSIVDRVSLWQS